MSKRTSSQMETIVTESSHPPHVVFERDLEILQKKIKTNAGGTPEYKQLEQEIEKTKSTLVDMKMKQNRILKEVYDKDIHAILARNNDPHIYTVGWKHSYNGETIFHPVKHAVFATKERAISAAKQLQADMGMILFVREYALKQMDDWSRFSLLIYTSVDNATVPDNSTPCTIHTQKI